MGQADPEQEVMGVTADDRLTTALQDAIDRFAAMSGEPFTHAVMIEADADDGFWAVAQAEDDDTYRITVAEGAMKALDRLWSTMISHTDLLRTDGTTATAKADELAAVSLAWLIHHEMEHIEMDHLALKPKRGISETAHPKARALIERAAEVSYSSPLEHGFETQDLRVVDRCLELRADHDAIEMILGPYSTDEWDLLRQRTAAIFAVMILIDLEDRRHGIIGETHPRSATRIFQLLGHLSILYSVPAQVKAWKEGRDSINPADLPPEDEIAAYTATVIQPAFRDAALIAAAAGADEIATELGDPIDFFADIDLALAKGAAEPKGFKTVGAIEWADLYAINEAAMARLGHRAQL
ncbi:MAG: hypothetical protein AAFR79_19685 [Pseudomonadota bacterium]